MLCGPYFKVWAEKGVSNGLADLRIGRIGSRQQRE